MIPTILAEAALRSMALGTAVGLGLWMMRARGARLRMTAWTLALVGALLMPALMQWQTVEITAPRRVVERAPAIVQTLRTHVPIPAAMPAAMPARPVPARTDWRVKATTAWLVVVTLLLLRTMIGFALSARIWRRATRINEPWATGMNVRESARIDAPATFGSGILLPMEWREWDDVRRRAVLAHEGEHVRWGDFYVQLLSRVHFAFFWFSPLAWWLRNRLTTLAEAASDDAALVAIEDRPGYAEILLDFARRPQRAFASVAMARSATVSRRVERILAGGPLHVTKRAAYAFVAGFVVCLAALIAGCTVHAQAPAASSFAQESAQAQPAAKPSPTAESKKADEARHGFQWRTGDHGDPYVIVSGDSITMSGSSEDVERARSHRPEGAGDYIWFDHDGRPYIITDPAVIRRAKELFKPQEELGRKQEELGRQQEALGEQQERLGEQQSGVKVRVPSMDARVDALRREVVELEQQLTRAHVDRLTSDTTFDELVKQVQAAKDKELTQEQLGELQSRLGEAQSALEDKFSQRLSDVQSRLADLQSAFGELQAKAGEAQERVAEQQSKLGEEQSRLGEQQSKLGEEQSRLAEHADRELRKLLESCVEDGRAKPAK